MAFWIYVLANPQGKTYVGQTVDLERRLAEHNDPTFHGTLHTKRHPGLWRLVHFEEYATRKEAMRRERELKTGKGREWLRRELLGGR